MLMEFWALFKVEAVAVGAWVRETQRQVCDLDESGSCGMLINVCPQVSRSEESACKVLRQQIKSPGFSPIKFAELHINKSSSALRQRHPPSTITLSRLQRRLTALLLVRTCSIAFDLS